MMQTCRLYQLRCSHIYVVALELPMPPYFIIEPRCGNALSLWTYLDGHGLPNFSANIPSAQSCHYSFWNLGEMDTNQGKYFDWVESSVVEDFDSGFANTFSLQEKDSNLNVTRFFSTDATDIVDGVITDLKPQTQQVFSSIDLDHLAVISLEFHSCSMA
jgi:hypothetical protein